MLIDAMAQDLNIYLNKANFGILYGDCKFNNKNVILAKPMTFINNSGKPISELISHFNVFL